MSHLVLLGICLLAGVLLRASGQVGAEGSKPLNLAVLYVALPALILEHVHALRFERSLLLPALMPWLVFSVGAGLFLLLWRLGILDRESTGALCLAAALGNTSFVGLPMIEAYYGKSLLGVGVMADQLGTFLCLNVPGVILAIRLAAREGERVSAAEILRKALLFPPLLALLVAVALRPVEYPEWAQALLVRLGDTLTPLALLSVGIQLHLGGLRRSRRELALGLGYKLLAAPLLSLAVFGLLFGARGPVFQVTVFEAAMAPMITGSIVAQEYGLDGELAALLVGAGIPISFLTLWGWFHLLARFE
ncbi:MAG TPA: AEC family transporter [Thermoanaerobaculia bacterium]|nr:AEC family transporter [Thermoanaerobaculia bacterium]